MNAFSNLQSLDGTSVSALDIWPPRIFAVCSWVVNLNIIGQFCQPEHAEHYAEHHAEQSQHHDIRVNVRSCLGSWLHKAPLSNILGQFGGAIHKVNYTQQHCLTFFHIT